MPLPGLLTSLTGEEAGKNQSSFFEFSFVPSQFNPIRRKKVKKSLSHPLGDLGGVRASYFFGGSQAGTEKILSSNGKEWGSGERKTKNRRKFLRT